MYSIEDSRYIISWGSHVFEVFSGLELSSKLPWRNMIFYSMTRSEEAAGLVHDVQQQASYDKWW